jgi:hypothetical protein
MKMKLNISIYITINVLFFCFYANAQTNKTYFLGHSLVNFNLPNMVNKLSIANALPFNHKVGIINGANLSFHYTNPIGAQGDAWSTTLPLGGFENFILTEAVPLQGHLTWSSTYRYADSFYTFAKINNPNIQMYIYETWHCTNSGNGSTSGVGGYPCDYDPLSTTPWRQRITNDLPLWESIADSINLIHTKPMLIIPAGQAMGRLADSISAGVVPGLTSINNLYSDNIHLDLRGNYFIACVMYAVIHKISPVGLPNQLTDEWGGLYATYPTVAQAAKMQQIAWQTVCAYNRDGVICNIPLGLNLDVIKDVIPMDLGRKYKYDVYNIVGQKMYTSKAYLNEKIILPNELPNGLYILKTKNETIKLVK